MSFKLLPLTADRWKLEFTYEPDYIHALMMAPESREGELDSGTWLVVAFPIWSSPVRHSVRSAIACAKEFGGRFQLGVRPFNYPEEFANWWPCAESPPPADQLIDVREGPTGREVRITSDPTANPIWLVLQDGQVTYQGP